MQISRSQMFELHDRYQMYLCNKKTRWLHVNVQSVAHRAFTAQYPKHMYLYKKAAMYLECTAPRLFLQSVYVHNIPSPCR